MLPHPPGLIAFQPALFFQMTKASKVGSTQTQMDHPWAHELARRAPSHSSQCSKRLIQSIDRNADLLTVFFLVISTGYRSVEKKTSQDHTSHFHHFNRMGSGSICAGMLSYRSANIRCMALQHA